MSTYINSFLYARILDDLLAGQYDNAVGFVLLVALVLTVQLISAACSQVYFHYDRV